MKKKNGSRVWGASITFSNSRNLPKVFWQWLLSWKYFRFSSISPVNYLHFGLWNSAINNECYEINFEPAKKSREWSENEAQLLNIIFFVKWENGVYKINETQAKNKVEEEFNKDGCSSFRAKLERFSKAETSSVRNEIYNQRGTEENYKFPRSIKLDYKQIVDRFLEIVKEKAGETSSILADNSSHDPLKEKKEETCKRIKNFLAEEGIKASDLHLTNQNWEKNVMKADFEWQIDNITRKVIVNTNFVKERIKTKSDQKVVGTTSNSKLGSSPTDSFGKKLEESIQNNDFSTQRNESNQETKETQPSNVTNPEVFPWKLAVPVFLLLAGSLVLGFLITKKEKPSQNQPRSRDTIKPTRN
jgi:hypothetical protein